MKFKEFIVAFSDWLEAHPALVFVLLSVVVLDYIVAVKKITMSHNTKNMLVYCPLDDRPYYDTCSLYFDTDNKCYLVVPDVYADKFAPFNKSIKLVSGDKHG